MERLDFDMMRRAVKRSPLAVIRPQHLQEEKSDWEEREELVEAEDASNAKMVEGHLVSSTAIPFKANLKVAPPKLPCSRCHGAGYLRQDVPFGHPHFGKLIECSCHKARRKEQEQQQLRDLSHLDTLKRFQRATFDNYEVALPGVDEAYNAAVEFAAHPKGWLVLAGPNGSGKTHLAVATAKERLTEGDTVLLQAVPDLLDHLRSGFSSSAEQSYQVLFEQMRRVDFLVLDDLGAQQNSPWANEKIFQLLNYRYNGMLPTLITTNSMNLEGFDPRVASRLMDRGLVKIVVMSDAQDYRPQQQEMEDEA